MTFHLIAWAVVQDPQGRVLLGRRAGTGYGAGLWGLPGGHVEPGETLAQAAAREAAEEVGVRLDPAGLRALGVSRYDTGGLQGCDFFYLARRWEGAPTPRAQTSEVGWFGLDDLPSDILPWLPAALAAHLTRGDWFVETVGEA